MPVLPAVGDELIALNNLAGGMPQRNAEAFPLGTALNELAAGSGGIPAPVGSATGDILVFDGVAWNNLVPGVAGTFLQSNGPGVLPTYAVVAGGGGTVQDTYDCPAGVAVADAVFMDAISNSVDEASAESGVGQTSAAIGIVISKPTAVTAVVVSAGAAAVFAGLTPGTRYWLDPATPGGITSTVPTGAGEALQPIGWAVTATKLLVEIGESTLLS